ncbi:ATP-binding protein [Methylorubrum sp. SB2]|uniref:sensor histidine kinase n=1 Tax=Methylorubrum subtropicum TaxID=3138812 RepID=UPI00313AB7EC
MTADKWRPSLGLVVLGVLAIVATLPLFGLFLIRVYENGPIREAEAELIAQSAVLAAVTARAIEALPEPERVLGAAAPPPVENERYQPIQPSLDLATADILGRRPDATDPGTPPDPALLAIGAGLLPVLERTQGVTLAGFRILDRDGTVIAGRNEVGRSLADLPEVAAALKGTFRSVLRQRVSDEPAPALTSISRGTRVRLFTAMPIRVGERVAGVVYASRTPSNLVRHLYGERVKLALAAAAVLAAVLAIAALFSRAITRPIHALVARSHAIARGDRAVLAEPGPLGTREIARLSRGLDRMAHELRERSDYIATFAAHVSHELKTPLTAIQGAAELMRDAQASPADAMSPAEQTRFLDNILADTGRLTALLGRLRELARADNPDIRGTTRLDAVWAGLRRAHPGLIVEADGNDRTVAISAENAGIVFAHLADNARRHGASRLRITAQASGETVVVHVADDGEGIPERNRAQVFETFFTTRREAGGTGMGLGIVRAMLRAHSGTIELLPAGERGAAFAVTLPAAGAV